jgi:predicted Rdx family selenoprotein
MPINYCADLNWLAVVSAISIQEIIFQHGREIVNVFYFPVLYGKLGS